MPKPQKKPGKKGQRNGKASKGRKPAAIKSPISKGKTKNKKNPLPIKRGPGRPKGQVKYSDEQLIVAIHANAGLLQAAAKSIGTCPGTFYERAKTSKDVADAIESEREELVDKAVQNLKDGMEKGDNWSTGMVLSNLGRKRGFGQPTKLEMSGPDGGPIPIEEKITIEKQTTFMLACISSLKRQLNGRGSPKGTGILDPAGEAGGPLGLEKPGPAEPLHALNGQSLE